MTTIANTQAQSAVISLSAFVQDFGNALRDAVDQQNPPIFHPEDAKPSRDVVMDSLLRKPFPVQREAVHAMTALLFDQGEKAGVLNAEMGTGKVRRIGV